MFKTLRYAIYMIVMRFRGFKVAYLKKKHGNDEANNYVFKLYKKWAKFTTNIIGIEIEVIGKENIPQEPCVFMPNHTSILDVPILINTMERNLGFISKKEVLKMPLIGYWLDKGKNVPLDRSNPKEGMKAIIKGVENLKDGFSMVVFPEGTRSKTGEIGELKKGSLKLATKSEAPIVPIYIDNASKCFEKDRKFVSGKVKVVFGKPIKTNNITKEEERELHKKVYESILNLKQ